VENIEKRRSTCKIVLESPRSASSNTSEKIIRVEEQAKSMLEENLINNKKFGIVDFNNHLIHGSRFITGVSSSGLGVSSFKDVMDNIKNIATVSAIVVICTAVFRSKSKLVIDFNLSHPHAAIFAKIGLTWFLVPLLVLLVYQGWAVFHLRSRAGRGTLSHLASFLIWGTHLATVILLLIATSYGIYISWFY
jgi:hypothetical protein